MAHELDEKADGSAAMIYAEEGGTPWHRLGEVIPEEKRRDLGWAMDAAGINFEVEKVPHFVWRPSTSDHPDAVETEDGWMRPIESDDAYSVVRTDREKVVGTVGEWWHPLQNEDAFAPLEPVLDDGLALIETGGVLRGGSQIWMLVRFDTEGIVESAYDRIDDEDGFTRDEYERLVDALHKEVGGGIRPYGLFLNDHTGSAKARVKETAIRVVCANTLDWSLAKDSGGVDIEVAHVANVEDKYRDATERLFGDLVARYVRLANFREILQQAHLPEEAFTKVVLDRAYPVKHLEQKIARREGNPSTEYALEQKSQKRKRIRVLWDEGDGMSGDHTSWDAYNAVVQYIDHDEESYQGPNRVQSLIDGSLRKSKSRIFRDLLDLSAAESEGEKQAILAN